MPGRTAGALLLLCLFLPAATLAATPSPYTGQSLAAALRALSEARVQFVFSSRLLPDSLTVGEIAGPLNPADPVASARTLLASRGLGLDPIGNGVFAVVRLAPSPAATPAPPAPSSAPDLGEIIVSASRYRFEDATASLSRLAGKDLADTPGIGEDPLRSLGQLPGIVQTDLSAQSHVRGGEEGETLTLLDGFPLRQVFHLQGYQTPFSVIDAGLVRSADIYTGGFPARYGNRMSAVFDLRTIDSGDEPAHSMGIDAFNASARAAGDGLGRFDWLASGRIGTLSPLLQTFAPAVGNPHYMDSYLRAGFGDADTLRVIANFLWARDELSIEDAKRGEKAQIEDRLRYFWLRADRNFNKAVSATVWLGQSVIGSMRDGQLDNPSQAVGSVLDMRSSTLWDLRAQLNWQLSDAHLFEFGGEFTRESGSYRYDASARYAEDVATLFGRSDSFDRHADLDPRRNRSSAFTAYRWRVTDRITAEAGLRVQLVVTEGESRWASTDPRLGLQWQLNPATQLHLNWGRYHQIDEIQELKVEDGLLAFPAPQLSEHLIVGVQHQLGNGVGLRLEAYSKQQAKPRARFENLFDRRTILPEIAPDRIGINPDYGRIHGVELTADYRAAHWRSWLSGGWARAEDTQSGIETLRSWDIGWSTSAGGAWDHGPWSASATVALHQGFPTTALLQTSTGTVIDERNGRRLPRFLNLNLRLDYVQTVALGQIRYSAELLNSLDQPNDCCTDLVRTSDGFTLRRLHGLPLLPSLGVRWSW